MKVIPVNLITGFLGVGKTTAILDLLQRKPTSERWAVIVNEYGEVGIDGAILSQANGVEIREVTGGCVCCTSSVEFHFALAQVIEFVKPDRILIETTGVGHPARILDDLRKPEWQRVLEVRATLGIIAPIDYTCQPMFESPVFRDQIELSDVLVMNKIESADPGVKEGFLAWAKELFPPKLMVATTERGRLELAWLDLGADLHRRALYPEAHQRHEEVTAAPSLQYPEPGQPLRKESRGPGGMACGWIFSPREVFDEDRLLQLLSGEEAILRLKGVFRTAEGWIVINRAGRETVTWATSYTRDSRLEVFSNNLPGGWLKFEERLKGCIVS